MNTDNQEKLKKVIEILLSKMGVSADIEMREIEGGLLFNLKTEDSAILIGQHGANLAALQYLARLLAFREIGEPSHFVVDVEGYKESREEFLRELARQAASRVKDTRENLILKPMAAYERRVVHAEISKDNDVVSESVGEEPERRIMIKPREDVQ